MAAEVPLFSARGMRLAVGSRLLIQTLDWEVRAGEFWCLLGPNGAGKTTLLKHAAAVSAPGSCQGALAWQERGRGAWTRDGLALLRAYLPQHTADAFDSSVLDAVLLGRHPHMGRWQWESRNDGAIALNCLEQVDMAALARRSVRTLSAGERQRVAIAALLAQEARLYLFDEPLSHQDLPHQSALARLFVKLAADGQAVVAAIHDLNIAVRYASHALLLDGRGGAYAGPVDAVVNAERLSDAFGAQLVEVDLAGRRGFIAA
ncbi:MAG: ABC transporter ATP-binding protein [Burkholderiales bacterium]